MKKFILSFWTFLALCPALWATHIVGGEMSYTFLNAVNGENRYKITLKVYRDCYNGVPPLDDPANIVIYNGLGILIINQLVPLGSVTTIPLTPQGSCRIMPQGICTEVGLYETEVQLPFDANGYFAVYQRCCRNQIITNIAIPEDVGATYAIFISGEAQLLQNSSPQWAILPPTLLCSNQPLFFDHAATDPDGDEITYFFGPALSGGTPDFPMPTPPLPPPFDTIEYISPYTIAAPLEGDPMVEINPQTGQITGTPTKNGHFVAAVYGSEFRNGQLLSTFYRDFEFVVGDCSQKQVVISLDPQAHPLCDTTYDHFTIIPSGGESPYTFNWSTGDTVATVTGIVPGALYQVTVTDATGCTTENTLQGNDCVWPGDTDYDGLANNMDVLNIGLFNGTYGPARPNASIEWVAQTGAYWTASLLSGTNLKHVDCDGSGFINNVDVGAVDLNYQQSHPLAFLPVTAENAPDLWFNLNYSVLDSSNQIIGEVRLGTPAQPAQKAYGIAFTIKSSNPEAGLIISPYFSNSIFGNAQHTVSLAKQLPGHRETDVVICNIDRVALNNINGTVCYFTLQSDSGTPGPVALSLEKIRLIDDKGKILPVNPVPTQIVVGQEEAIAAAQTLRIQPNPASGEAQLWLPESGTGDATVEVYDAIGRLVHRRSWGATERNIRLRTLDWGNGHYTVLVRQEQQVFSGKLVVFHPH